MAGAEFLRAVFEEADQGPVDVAEAEEAEVVGADGNLLESVPLSGCAGETPPLQPAGRRRYFPPLRGPMKLGYRQRLSPHQSCRNVSYPITVVCSGLIL